MSSAFAYVRHADEHSARTSADCVDHKVVDPRRTDAARVPRPTRIVYGAIFEQAIATAGASKRGVARAARVGEKTVRRWCSGETPLTIDRLDSLPVGVVRALLMLLGTRIETRALPRLKTEAAADPVEISRALEALKGGGS